MMKITLFVFAVLLVAVAFAVPHPEAVDAPATDKKPLNLEDLTKLLTGVFENAKKEIEGVATQENMDKLQAAWADGLKKTQETLENLIQTNKKD